MDEASRMDAAQLLTIEEFIAKSRLSVSTIHRLKRQGKIPYFQPAGKGGKLLFPPDAIECAAGLASGQPSIPIHPRLRKLLEALERKPDGYVFHARRGGRLRPRNVLHMFIRDVIEPLKKRFPTPPGEIGFEHGRLHSFAITSAARPSSAAPRKGRSRSGSAMQTAKWSNTTATCATRTRSGRWSKSTSWRRRANRIAPPTPSSFVLFVSLNPGVCNGPGNRWVP